jgi:hypothetical protein
MQCVSVMHTRHTHMHPTMCATRVSTAPALSPGTRSIPAHTRGQVSTHTCTHARTATRHITHRLVPVTRVVQASEVSCNHHLRRRHKHILHSACTPHVTALTDTNHHKQFYHTSAYAPSCPNPSHRRRCRLEGGGGVGVRSWNTTHAQPLSIDVAAHAQPSPYTPPAPPHQRHDIAAPTASQRPHAGSRRACHRSALSEIMHTHTPTPHLCRQRKARCQLRAR